MRLAVIAAIVAPLSLAAAPAPKGKPSLYHATKVGDELVYEIKDGDMISERTDRVVAVEEMDGAVVVSIVLGFKKDLSTAPRKLIVSEKGVFLLSDGINTTAQ